MHYQLAYLSVLLRTNTYYLNVSHVAAYSVYRIAMSVCSVQSHGVGNVMLQFFLLSIFGNFRIKFEALNENSPSSKASVELGLRFISAANLIQIGSVFV